MAQLPTPAAPWMAGANNGPIVPPFQPSDTSNPPEYPATAGLGGGISAPMAPAAPQPPKPEESVARHILDALGGSSGKPMDWAKSILSGGLAAAANVGRQPEGAGWLRGAAQGAQGLQEQKQIALQNQQKQQEMQLKQKQDARAEQELQIHMEDAKTQRAMWTAQTAASIQAQQQNAARFETLQTEDKLHVKELQDNIQKSEQDNLAILSAAGVDVTKLEHITDSSQLTSSHAKQAGAGDIFPVPNGEAHAAGEDKAGAYLVPGNVWEQPIKEPVTITTGWNIDPKSGKATPVQTTAQAGTKVGDLLAIAKGAQMDLAQKQKVIVDQADIKAKQAALEHEQAATAHEEAQTKLTNLQAKQYITDNTPNALGDTGGIDPATGNALTPKEATSRYDKFNEKVLEPLQTNTEKSFKMAQNAYAEYQAAGGHLPTGAQGMLMLSQHLSTTFGNVKGARVTKDMIQEHLGARGVSDSALTAIQRLTNGDPLSPDQWKAFNDLIGQSREYSYDGAIDSARSQGLGKSIQAWLPKAPAPGTKIDPSTARIYLYAAHGDPNKALDAAKAVGWGVQ
jgi:hypothetical protein